MKNRLQSLFELFIFISKIISITSFYLVNCIISSKNNYSLSQTEEPLKKSTQELNCAFE